MNNTKNMPASITKSDVEHMLDNVVIDEMEVDVMQSIYQSEGLEIAVRTYRQAGNTYPTAFLYILNGEEYTRIPGGYREDDDAGRQFVIRNLIKNWYGHLADRACEE